MADEKPGTAGPSREGNGSGKETGSTENVENFGPVSSLEPDGVGPLEAGPESAAFQERFFISVTWESVSGTKAERPKQRAKVAKAKAGKAAKHVAASDQGKAAGSGKALPQRGRMEGEAAEPGKQGADWTRASRSEAPREAESENDAMLLDDAFLRRTFKDVRFPARKELVLRFVDQEQDFIFGKDRTVNLHNLIAHLDEDLFPTRRDLMHAVKDRLLHHHH